MWVVYYLKYDHATKNTYEAYTIHSVDGSTTTLLDAVAKLSVGSVCTFEFKMTKYNAGYSMITTGFDRVALYQTDGNATRKFVHAFVPVEITIDEYGNKNVYCESEFTFFNDILLPPKKYALSNAGLLFNSIMSDYNSIAYTAQDFTYNNAVSGVNTDRVCYSNFNTVMESLKSDLIDDYGGFLDLYDLSSISYRNTPKGYVCGVISLGRNILTATKTVNLDNLCTRLYPLGASMDYKVANTTFDKLTLAYGQNTVPALYVTPDNATELEYKYGKIEKTISFDDITKVSNLRSRAQRWLAENNTVTEEVEIVACNVNISTSSNSLEYPSGVTGQAFLEWQSPEIGYAYFVRSDDHNIAEWMMCQEATYNLNEPEKDTFKFGNKLTESLTASEGKTTFSDESTASRMPSISSASGFSANSLKIDVNSNIATISAYGRLTATAKKWTTVASVADAEPSTVAATAGWCVKNVLGVRLTTAGLLQVYSESELSSHIIYVSLCYPIN